MRGEGAVAANTLFRDKNTLLAPDQGIERNRLSAHHNGSTVVRKWHRKPIDFEKLPDIYPDRREIPRRGHSHWRPAPPASVARLVGWARP
jgi:hypothetical protein